MVWNSHGATMPFELKVFVPPWIWRYAPKKIAEWCGVMGALEEIVREGFASASALGSTRLSRRDYFPALVPGKGTCFFPRLAV